MSADMFEPLEPDITDVWLDGTITGSLPPPPSLFVK
jgi:hypothetical protein